MYGFGVCEIPVVLQIIYFIKILINLVKFIVPIGLIIMVSLDFGKGTYNRNGWFDTDEVLTAIKEVHMCVSSQSLIDKFN